MANPEPAGMVEGAETRFSRGTRAENGFLNSREVLGLLAVVALPFLFYWRAMLGAGMFFFGDIARFFFPTKALYANALQAGRLPFWQPEILTGIPLAAEMQTGVFYPLHLVLFRLLPVDLALNYDILLHLGWLAVGAYLLARIRRISIAGAVLAAMTLTLGGFGAARITHPNVLAVASWLPWLLWLYQVWRKGVYAMLVWIGMVFAVALQWLGGHPQFALINLLTFIGYVLGMSLWVDREQRAMPAPLDAEAAETTALVPANTAEPDAAATADAPPENGSARLRASVSRWLPQSSSLLFPFAAVVIGTLIAGVQLLPTFAFSQQSLRAGGVDPEFFTTFSYNPLYLFLLVAPFFRGNPFPNTSVEVIAYVGLVPLIFAAAAVILRRTRETWFWLALAAVALLLAFGGYTPIYPALRALPFFNLFRVPARFLFPFAFAIAMLAGIGFDHLRAQTYVSRIVRNAFLTILGAAALALLILLLIQIAPVDAWLDAWRILPVIFGALALLLVLRAARMDRAFFTAAALGLTLIDLMSFSAVYALTYNQIAPRDEVFPKPRVLDSLALKDGAHVLTSEWILPWVSVMNASLYPNLNAIHGVTAAGGYTPLVPLKTREFLDNLSPVMLNKLGVRYYLIPQLLPVDAKTEGADVHDPFLIDPISQPLDFDPVDADGLQVDSALAQSVNLPTGAVVAEVVLTDQAGKEYRLPLRAGIDTAEWAYDRPDVRQVIKHAMPEIGSSFPARSAFPIQEHVGHTYRSRINFAPSPVPIVKLRVEPKLNAGLVHIQRLAFLVGDAEIDLAPLLGKGRHTLVYRSEDVAVYENPDASPRTFITHNVKRATDEEAFHQLRSPLPNAEIYVSDGPEFESDVGQGLNERAEAILYEPERVIVDTKLDSPGYLVLTDAWDPGWVATVDGVPAPIARADVIFRAVLLNEGAHRVEFLYRPRSLYFGLLVTGIGILLVGIVVLASWLVRVGSGKGNAQQVSALA